MCKICEKEKKLQKARNELRGIEAQIFTPGIKYPEVDKRWDELEQIIKELTDGKSSR